MPAGRVVRWCANFAERHGSPTYAVVAGGLSVRADDGSTALLRLPLDETFTGPATPEALAEAVVAPGAWGVLLVRKGGFAVARMAGERLVEHKIGQRHVQGRTKAGGQSQQRFARRRDNQARAAYEAAADHAARILGGHRLDALVTGGDQGAVDTVLEDTRLAHAASRRTTLWLPVGDPKRAVLDQAVQDALAVQVDVTNA